MPVLLIHLALILSCQIQAPGDFETVKLDNWHHWRGPLANGYAPHANPPVNWSASSNIKWKVELAGRGSSTPVVWGNKIFVMSARKTDRVATASEIPTPDPRFDTKTTPPDHFYKFFVQCLDCETGKVLWERLAAEAVPHEGHHDTHSYAGGSPTTDGNFVYASFGSFGTYCYDLDGNLKWSRDLGRLHTRLGWGEAVTPVVAGDALLLNLDQEVDSALVCLDAKTGKTRWVAHRDEKTSWNTPLVIREGQLLQVITNGTKRIRSHDLASGELLWSCAGMTINSIPSPVAFEDTVICMSGYKGSNAMAIPLSSRGDLGDNGGTRWSYKNATPYVPSPLLIGNRLYFTASNDPFLTILDAKTGKPFLEKERLPQLKNLYASPVAASGRIYITDRSGTTLVIKADDGLEVLAVNKLDETIDASPVLVGNKLLLRGEHNLYCIEQP